MMERNPTVCWLSCQLNKPIFSVFRFWHLFTTFHLLYLGLLPHIGLLQLVGQDPPEHTTVRLSLALIERLNDYYWWIVIGQVVGHIPFPGTMRRVGNIPSLAATGSGLLGLFGLDDSVVQVQNLGGGLLKPILQPKILAASLALLQLLLLADLPVLHPVLGQLISLNRRCYFKSVAWTLTLSSTLFNYPW